MLQCNEMTFHSPLRRIKQIDLLCLWLWTIFVALLRPLSIVQGPFENMDTGMCLNSAQSSLELQSEAETASGSSISLLAINSFSGCAWQSGEKENSHCYMTNWVCSTGKQPSREQRPAKCRGRWAVQLEALQLYQGLSLLFITGGWVSVLLKA